jgi:predicted nucleic acid-binding protein
MKIIRIYLDTSVFGGVFDTQFELPSRKLFKEIEKGKFKLVTSALVETELEPAPSEIRNCFRRNLPRAEIADVTREALELRDVYLNEGIVTENSQEDALHVAIASVSNCSIIVSWNFKHIVHFDRIPLYNAMNRINGYPEIDIYSPQEVISYEED